MEPNLDYFDLYSKIQSFVKKDAEDISQNTYKDLGTQYGVADIPFHVHNGVDSPNIPYANILGLPVFASTPTKSGQNGQLILVGTSSYTLYAFISGVWTAVGGAGGSVAGNNTDIQFNDSGAFGGQDSFTFDKNNDLVILGTEGNTSKIQAPDAVTSDTTGGGINIFSGAGTGTQTGGSVGVQGGTGGTTGAGGTASIQGGTGGGTSGAGGDTSIQGGNGGTLGAGGVVNVFGGAAGGSDTDGGAININGGDAASGDANGGTVSIIGGAGIGTGNGGAAVIFGGVTTGTSGGVVLIQGGQPSAGNFDGGSVSVQGGAKHGSGDVGSVYLGNGSLATTANGGFPIIAYTGGTPTGTPPQAGAIVYDTGANKLWVWNGSAWKFASFT